MHDKIDTLKRFVKAQGIVAAGIICFGLAIVGGLSHTAAYIYASHASELFTINQPSQILDADLKPTTTIVAGEGINIRHQLHYAPQDCYGLYVQSLQGPVSYQFEPMRSNLSLVSKPTDIDVVIHMETPKHLPQGEYHLSMTVYPTCEGLNMVPKRYDLGADVTILSK